MSTIRCSTATITTRIPRPCRGTIAITPSSDFRIDLTADYSEDDAHLTVGQPLNSLTYLVGGGTALALPTNPTSYDFTGRTTPGLPNSTRLTHWGLAANVACDVTAELTLRSITAYRAARTPTIMSISTRPSCEMGDVFVGVDQNQFSQEFQAHLYRRAADRRSPASIICASISTRTRRPMPTT